MSYNPASGSGDVSKVGTPVNNQIGVWTGDGTLEGDPELTYENDTFQQILSFGENNSDIKWLWTGSNTGRLTLNGGNSGFNGANITMYGNAHATNANDLAFGAAADSIMRYDDSANLFLHDTPVQFNGDPSVAPINITPDAGAPTTPNDGDIWVTSAGLFVRINGATVGPLS